MHNKDRYILLGSSLEPSELFKQKQDKMVNPGTTFKLRSPEGGDEISIRANLEKITKVDDKGHYEFVGFLSERLRTEDGVYPEVTRIDGFLSDNDYETCALFISKEDRQKAEYFPPIEDNKDFISKRKVTFDALLYHRFRFEHSTLMA